VEYYHYIIAFIGAILAGSINTLAGNGSAITLSILTELLGLPGNFANGTNRIGVLFNGFGGTLGFYRNGRIDFKKGWHVIIPTTIGAVVGVIVAVQISHEQFRLIFRYLMIVMLIVLLVKPKRWLLKSQGKSLMSPLLSMTVFLALGFYGGFIQMGMGIFFLAALVLASRIPIIDANALKVVVVTLYTFLVVAIFQWKGLIHWPIGLLMGAGQFVGGYATSHYASNYKGADLWAYRFLVVIVVLSIFSLFDLLPSYA
jgi:uncharacterized membrane protein YfcA